MTDRPMDRQTDRPTKLGIEAPSPELRKIALALGSSVNYCLMYIWVTKINVKKITVNSSKKCFIK